MSEESRAMLILLSPHPETVLGYFRELLLNLRAEIELVFVVGLEDEKPVWYCYALLFPSQRRAETFAKRVEWGIAQRPEIFAGCKLIEVEWNE